MKRKIIRRLEDLCRKKFPEQVIDFMVERPKLKSHGEFSTNLALVLAKKMGRKPFEVADEIRTELLGSSFFRDVSIAGPGFLNFLMHPKDWYSHLHEMMNDPDGQVFRFGAGKRCLLEYVSANPTGPLHIGNARGGPLGDVIASLLEEVGYEVTREFYLNDVGGQIDKLGESVLYWIENNFDETVAPPEGYQGDYVREVARQASETLTSALEKTEDRQQLVHVLGRFGVKFLTEKIREDCAEMRISFDSWVSEKEILVSRTQTVLDQLMKKGVTHRKEGALWFSPQDDFLEDRECVLERSDGRPTYFANDIAYHLYKYQRNFDLMINIWGSNHHGHIPRLLAAMKCLGEDPEKLKTVLYQYVRVKRGQEVVKMSKRGGNFVTTREVLDEVGADAVRFFLLMRAPESHLDFDLELATRKNQENPVYYVQYAHARICAIENRALEAGAPNLDLQQNVPLELLSLEEESDLIRMVCAYADTVEEAALRQEPHRLTFYALELAKLFQSYYARAKEDPRYRVISDEKETSLAKRYLCLSVQKILKRCLEILGISAPLKM